MTTISNVDNARTEPLRTRVPVAESSKLPRLSVRYLAMSDVRANPENPRVHSTKQTKQIAKSIETFGFVAPMLVDSEGILIAGEGRFRAAKMLGITEVPVISITHLTKKQLTALTIADNKLTENAKWNMQLLGEQLKTLSAVDLDFSVDVTGFEIGEIDLLVEGIAPETDGENDPADDLPETPAGGDPVSSLGDLWKLGRNLVYCGNSLNNSSFSALMNDRRAAMVFSDPPYNVAVDRVTGLGKIQHTNFKMAAGEMNEAEFSDFLAQAFSLLAGHSTDGSIHYHFMDWRHTAEIIRAGKQSYSELKNVCVWVKDNAGMGSLYRSQHELIFVFKSGKASHRNNVQLGQFGRYRTNVWSYPGANSFARTTTEGNLLELHPTVKPAALVADAIMDCSARGEIVLDPFLGSGTTLMAAERTGRICYGIELDPGYVDTAIRRWQNFTGQKAIHSESNRLFDDLQQEVKSGIQP